MARLTEEQIDKVINRLTKRIEAANTYFLKSIGSSIKKIRSISPSQAHQLEQILKYGGTYEEIIKKLEKYTEMNIKDIDEIFTAYAKQDQQFYKQFYKYRDVPFVPFEQNNALKLQTAALANMARNDMYNFTRTNVLGYTMADVEGNIYFSGLRETYNRVLDTAFLNVSQGKQTFDTALLGIMKQLGASGIKTLNYESGASIRLDSAVRMHLKSRLRELHNENQMIIGQEIGADGVEISVHLNPAPDHADIQGRQFTLKEYEKLQAGEKAKDYKGNVVMIGHSKNGAYRPISEYNCYHYVFSVVLGVNKPEYTQEQLQQINEENERGFEFEGKHYTNYEGTQLQRRMETEAHDWKNLQMAGKTSGNDTLVQLSQQKISEINRKYNELVKESSLPSKMDRARVPGYKRAKVNVELPKKADASNTTLQFAAKSDNVSIVIPEGVKLEGVKAIAGYGTSTPIKNSMKLYKEYPQLPQTWQKMRSTTYYNGQKYEIHYFENSGKQYNVKIKRIIEKQKGDK